MKHLYASLLLLLLLLLPLLAPFSSSADTAPAAAAIPGTIDRTTKQMVITTIPPGSADSSAPQPFLTSPSGKYTAFLLRAATAPGAGGFGNDFCYIQVQDTETSQPVWESECTPISTSNACSLVFDDDGLAIFDGSTPQWDTGAESADNNPLQRVEMVDEGDMRIRDEIGELAWRASEDPRVNQRCGEPGSPGLGPALPPFAQPIGGSQNLPFGQEQGQGSGNGARQAFGFDGEQQPGGGVFENGSKRGVIGSWVGVAGALVVCWFGF